MGGGTPSTNNDAYWDGEIDWYSPAELGEQVYADRSVRRITQAGYDSCSATLLPAGKTILFTSRAGIGNTAILRRSACTNQGFQSLVVNDDIDVYFVYSMTDRIKKFAEQKASGSTFLEISGKGLAAGEFAFPSKDEHAAIGSMFKQLDNLITLHQCKCQHCSLCGYLSWEQRKFSDVAVIRRGLTYSPTNIVDGADGVRVLRSSNINEDHFVLNDDDVFVDEGAVNIDLVHDLPGKTVHGGFMLVASSPCSDFLCASMGSSWYRRFLATGVAGGSGAIGNLDSKALGETTIAVPNDAEIDKLGNFFTRLDSLITLHR